jgi:hypothetical protein
MKYSTTLCALLFVACGDSMAEPVVPAGEMPLQATTLIESPEDFPSDFPEEYRVWTSIISQSAWPTFDGMSASGFMDALFKANRGESNVWVTLFDGNTQIAQSPAATDVVNAGLPGATNSLSPQATLSMANSCGDLRADAHGNFTIGGAPISWTVFNWAPPRG